MAKQKQNLFKSRFIVTAACSFTFFISLGCKSVEPGLIENKIPSPFELKSVKSTFDISLSSNEVPDGTLLFVVLRPLVTVDLSKIKIKFENEEFPFFKINDDAKEYGSLVVVPFNSKPRKTTVDISWELDSKKETASIPVDVIDGHYKSETLSVDEKKVTPPKKVMKRIMKEQKEIGAIYKTITPEKMWSTSFQFPLDTELTSPFGTKRVYNGHMNGFHQGLDFRARTPIPIQAPENARVALAKDLYFTGNTVILDHGFGLFTIYGHMSKLSVKAEERVKKAQIIGLTGASGRATGPHLHWGAVLLRQKFNPLDLKRVLR